MYGLTIGMLGTTPPVPVPLPLPLPAPPLPDLAAKENKQILVQPPQLQPTRAILVVDTTELLLLGNDDELDTLLLLLLLALFWFCWLETAVLEATLERKLSSVQTRVKIFLSRIKMS